MDEIVSSPVTDNLIARLTEIYNRLFDHFGHRNWWPGDTPYEVIIGAILTQNTTWTNVERAISNLKLNDVLSCEAISSLPVDQLAAYIRPTGYYNQKARRLKTVTDWLIRSCEGDLDQMKDKATSDVRNELLSLNGIGQETADSILLYAFERPVFVVDAYTRRAMARLGMTDENYSYQTLQTLFMNNLPHDVSLFNDYHAQIIALGKNYCRTKPLCGKCPLVNS